MYLSKALVGWDLVKADQTSQLRGGKYAARIQTGYEKDGSPQYRYFKTMDEYEAYLNHQGKSKKKDKDDKDKKTPAEKEATKREAKLKSRQSSIYTKKSKKVSKSLPLYIAEDSDE
jgi:hypothetical protein